MSEFLEFNMLGLNLFNFWLMMKRLFERLTQVNHVYLSEVIPSRENYHGYAVTDVAITANSNCIILREQEGGMINLKNLDERATIIRSSYVWSFENNCVKLERVKRQKTELLLEMYKHKGHLNPLICGEMMEKNIHSEILIIDDCIEVNISRGWGADEAHVCLEFSALRRSKRKKKLAQD